MATLMKEIANELQRHRKLAGLTQAELASMAGVGKTTVFDLESGKETVRFANLVKVLAVLGLDLRLCSRLETEP